VAFSAGGDGDSGLLEETRFRLAFAGWPPECGGDARREERPTVKARRASRPPLRIRNFVRNNSWIGAFVGKTRYTKRSLSMTRLFPLALGIRLVAATSSTASTTTSSTASSTTAALGKHGALRELNFPHSSQVVVSAIAVQL
jgi:hypothetical protein